MIETGQPKAYETPEFKFIRQDESDMIFFATSGVAPVTSGISTMTRNTATEW